ncbi:hypothetical protein PVAND_015645 [Polypedilum vanderplanki]|uniref:F-box domain-containing protein n=1 Tax=Polypedilum vanderplanki TaxID=319348 RepID=A0A9J6BCS0_POLVA|nr:hypothetical protein PVAND_015645 [Polypedilum vanderplanki]
MRRKFEIMKDSFDVLDFPNEILIKIFKLVQNNKNLSQTCKKFYELISKLNEKNVSLCVDYRYLINLSFDIDNFLQSSSSISLTIDKNFTTIKNYNERLEDFIQIYGKRLKIIGHRDSFDLENLLKNLQLESLTFFQPLSQLNLFTANLENQKQLKELVMHVPSREDFNTICENLQDLEKLEFGVSDDLLTLSDFIKISNLKKLKVLSINRRLNFDYFNEFSKIKFENLEDLTLSLHMKLTENSFDIFLQNYSKLKSLDLAIKELKCLKVITNVLEKFNHLESLHLYFQNDLEIENSEIEQFYKTNHKNAKLKTLVFEAKTFDAKKLITKFIHDFPNLEKLYIFFTSSDDLIENFELILKGFPKLKIIENLVITEEILGTFLKYGKNLEKFQIDINMLENPNEILKDCSIALKGWKTLASITRENEKNFDLSMMIYNHWKKIKTLMDLKKQLKNLEIFSLRGHKFCDKIISHQTNVSFENVTDFTLQSNISSSQLDAFLKAVSNLEILTFDGINFLKDSENIVQIENEKIQTICVKLDLSYSRIKNEIQKLNELLTNIRFSVKSLKILIKNVENFEDENYYEKIKS